MAGHEQCFYRQESGQTLFEYALVLLLIALVVIISLTLLGQNLSALLLNAAQGI